MVFSNISFIRIESITNCTYKGVGGVDYNLSSTMTWWGYLAGKQLCTLGTSKYYHYYESISRLLFLYFCISTESTITFIHFWHLEVHKFWKYMWTIFNKYPIHTTTLLPLSTNKLTFNTSTARTDSSTNSIHHFH